MNIIVGLGNPGGAYQNSRHNAGFVILDNLSKTMGCSEFTSFKKAKSLICKVKENIFVKPQTFMNGSGFAVRAVLDYYIKSSEIGENELEGLKNLYVIHDDLDIPLGSFKIQYGIGPKGHNGLLSLYQHLSTKNFWHIRVGVDNREGDRSTSPESYVLKKFSLSELDKLSQVKIDLTKKLLLLLK